MRKIKRPQGFWCKKLNFPLIEVAKIVRETCLVGEDVEFSLDMINVRCLLNIQVRLSSQQLGVGICSSGDDAS